MADDLEKPTKSRPVVLRDEKGRLLKGGANMNPGGRPKGLANRIREQTNNLEEQIQVMIEFSTGKRKCTARDMQEAIKWLADRGFGRAVETQAQIQLDSETSQAAADLSTDQLLELADLAKKAG